MPSACGMLVYKLDTSMVTRIAFCGTFNVSIIWAKCLESLTYDGVKGTVFFSCRSTKWDSFSVGPEHPETIGLKFSVS